MAYPQGDALARLLAQFIKAPAATTTALKAYPLEERVDGMMALVTADNSTWRYDSASTSLATTDALIPSDTPTAGRWIRLGAAASLGKSSAGSRAVRGVVYTDVASLAAFTVASDDGITYIEGDRVLLTAQATAAQCGIYVVGVVATGTAALTRAPDMAAGLVLTNGSTVEVSEGTVYSNSTWKATATTTGGAVIGTNDPAFYPRCYKQTVTLASGTYTIGFGSTATPDEPLFLLSTTKSMVNITRDTPGGTVATTIMYVAPVASRVAGKPGTAVVLVRSAIGDGSILNTDNSTLSVLVTNW